MGLRYRSLFCCVLGVVTGSRNAIATPTASQGWSHVDSDSGVVKYSALGLFVGTGPKSVIAKVEKHSSNPLFVQDKPWETRLDNGYPNVVYDEVDGTARWQLWYGGCINGCQNQVVEYANSSDGIHWNKPNLAKYDLGSKFPQLKKYGKNNNIVLFGGGLGVYKDLHETDPSKLYKMSGGSPAGCYGDDGNSNCVTGTAASPDGIHAWSDVTPISFPKPWRPDCHTNVVYGERQGNYLMTTRDYVSPAGRAIAIATSGQGQSHYTKNWTKLYSNEYPPTVETGGCEKTHGNVTDSVSACGEMCRESPSCAFFWVYTKGASAGSCCPKKSILPGPMMKPACASCGGEFYSMDGPPTKSNSSGGFGNWSDPVLVETGNVDHQLYSQITFPFYDIYLGLVMVYDATDGTVGPNAGHVHCRLSWSHDTTTWAWVDQGGLTGSDYIPAGEQGTFDSHICFAAHKPVRTTSGADLYYMGGNGPHSGSRNSSFALARLPGVDRFAGVGQGSGTTRMITVTGNVMTITMDVQSVNATVTISVASANIVSDALKVNMTDGVVSWTTKEALEPLVGTNVSFTIEIDSATIYTIGFYSK